MASFHELTTAQLRQALQIREQIESLQAKLAALLGGTAPATKGGSTASAGRRKKTGAASKAKAAPIPMVAKKKGGLTAAGRAKLSAAMKARWAARKQAA